MRIVESRATALTVRYPRSAPEMVPVIAPVTPRAATPAPRPAHPGRDAAPDSGFVMQLIATAVPAQADPPAIHAAGIAYGATRPKRSGDRIMRSI